MATECSPGRGRSSVWAFIVAELCAADPELARKSQTAILHRLSSVGQKPVADALSVSEATISRLKAEGVESFTAFLGVLKLKVVPAEMKCYSPDYVEHLRFFARRGMAIDDGTQQLPVQTLRFEDGQE